MSVTPQLQGKRILLIVGGGIAAYKALELVRRLRERGASVRAVMTAAAREFVTPLSFASLTGDTVYESLFSLTDEAEMGHIELSRDADLLVIAPATAGLLAKVANGLADDLASTLLLATDKRVLAAPAMNLRMWLHPATMRNVAVLRADGMLFTGPDDGAMACGEYGPGRMSEPLAIVEAIAQALQQPTAISLPPGLGVPRSQPLAGKHVIVTSGPTHEPIDPVRFIGNRSSGKQGHAIAAAAAAAGARVTLVSGPVTLADPAGLKTIHVETAQAMQTAVDAAMPADVFIGVAAVADWRVERVASDKLKKSRGGPPQLVLVENPDILAGVAARRTGRPALVVGFAAETQDIVAQAQAKRVRKNADLIVVNDVGGGSDVFGGERNVVHLVDRDGIEDWPSLMKSDVAERLIARIAAMLAERAT